MNRSRRALVAAGAAVAIFFLVQVGALALVEPFDAAGYQSVEDPQDPTNSLLYVGILLVATAGMLALLKLNGRRFLRGFILLTAGIISWYVFSVVLPVVPVDVGGTTVNVAALGGGAVVALALAVHPEWYVIDSAGVVMGAGAAALFGISLGVLPVLVLLVLLAIYDAISVYGTEHMLTLASGVMAMKVPVVLVIPFHLGYSYRSADVPVTEEDAEAADAETETGTGAETSGEMAAAGDGGSGQDIRGVDPLEREAFFIGLGDAVMPTILVASAAVFLDAPAIAVPGLSLNLPALFAMVGTLVGLVVLIRMVMKGRAHAGLPLLNGGAILGYLVGALAAGVPLAEAVGLAGYL